MKSSILLNCGALLLENQLSIAFAESATAGRLAAEFSLLPHARKFLKGALVCYDASLKEALLNVPGGLIKTFTPESMEVSMAMASGLEKLIPADLHLAVTGLLSPGGTETPEKPIGSQFIHCRLFGKGLFSEKVRFEGSPEEILRQTVVYTASTLIGALTHSPMEMRQLSRT